MTNQPRRPTRRRLLLVLAVLLTVSTAVGIGLAGSTGGDQPQTVPLTEVLAHVDGSDVRAATLDDGAGTVDLTLRDGSQVRSRFPAAYADELTDRLLDADVPIESQTSARQSAVLDAALRVVPVALILLVMVWAVRNATPNGILGAKHAKAMVGDGIPSVTFDDVAGVDEAVADLREMVQFLTEPERFQRVGAR